MIDAARDGMDPDVRPQDDLFGHVNGRWFETVEIPADRSGWGAFHQLAEAAEQHVREIVEGCSADDEDADRRKIGALYASFMNTDEIARRGTRPLRPMIGAIESLRDVRDLAAFLGEYERFGGHGLFGSYVNNDDRDSDRYLFHLVQGGLGLPDEAYYREEQFAEIREAYVGYLERLLGLVDRADPAADAATIMDLDTALAGGHWDIVRTRDPQATYNLLTAAELRELCPAFDWSAYVTNLGAADIDPELVLAEVCVREPSYFERLSQLLESEPIERWRVWLLSRVLRSAAPYLSDEFVETNFDFYGRTLDGTPQLRERWKRGVSFVEGSIGEAVGREYVARHFPPASKAQMQQLVDNLLEAYRESISKLDWMGDETKQRAYEKLETFRPKIGYPERFRDYSALTVRRDDLMGNVAAASAFETDRQLRKIGSPVDRDEWLMLPQTVNAYYNPGINEICFPAAILQPPFFAPDAHPAENYGGIGAVIGHEIGHGFDDRGAQYDARGNLDDWWTADDKAAFEERTKKLIDQFEGTAPRDVPDVGVNGALTVGENIGDLGGLTIGHLAYLIACGGSASAEERRLLFLSWGHIWRTRRRPEQQRQLIAVDPHSPADLRCNIARNLEEFHEVFGTQPGDGMWLDPDQRVRIW